MTEVQKFRADRDEMIRRLDAMGLSRPVIASAVCMSQAGLAYRIRKLGLQKATPKRSPVLSRMSAAWMADATPTEIAMAAGVSVSWASRVRRAALDEVYG